MIGITTIVCVVAIVSYLVLYPLDPNLKHGSFVWIPPTDEQDAAQIGEGFRRTTELFPSETDSVKLHGWLYLPTSSAAKEKESLPPVILMACGFGSQKDIALEIYAEEFIKNGFAVFSFDYRYWGGSGGFPRHIIHPPSLVEDWKSAVDHVLNSEGFKGQVNSKRIALWGSSYSGGHVIVTAAELQKKDRKRYEAIKCIVSQVPSVKTDNSITKLFKKRGFFKSFRLIASMLSDMARKILNRPDVLPPLYVRIASIQTTAEISAMPLPVDEFNLWQSRRLNKTLLGGWQNWVAARSLAYAVDYSPLDRAQDIDLPTFLISAEFDHLCPPEDVEEVARIINANIPVDSPPLAEIYSVPSSHFDVYQEFRSLILSKTILFLNAHL